MAYLIGRTLGCLLASAIILLTVFLYLQSPYTNIVDKQVWRGDSLSLLSPGGVVLQENGGLLVTALSQNTPVSLAVSGLLLLTANYPVAVVNLTGLSIGRQIKFSWRSTDKKADYHNIKLRWGGDGALYLDMRQVTAWTGKIGELRLDMVAPKGASVQVNGLELAPWRPVTVLRLVWSQWTNFGGWRSNSVIYVDEWHKNTLVFPVVAGAAWLGLSLLFNLVITWTGRRYASGIAAIMFILIWLLLDVRWQMHMGRQLLETYHRYAGKNWEQKMLVADDGRLFRFVSQARMHMLPPPQRVFLVARYNGENSPSYAHTRVAYHLLPNNVYAYPMDPADAISFARAGDYLLVLYAPPQLNHGFMQRILDASGFRSKAIFQDKVGGLYRLSKR